MDQWVKRMLHSMRKAQLPVNAGGYDDVNSNGNNGKVEMEDPLSKLASLLAEK